MIELTSHTRNRLLPAAFALLLALGAPAWAETLTFESLSPGRDSVGIPNGYGGLNWNNFGVLCGSCQSANSGYHAAPVSPTNVAFNVYGDPASISVNSNVFDLNSAYLTAALNLDSPLQVRVQGFAGTNLLYDRAYIVNKSSPTNVNFNYLGVTRVTFTTSPSIQFAMDDMVVSFPDVCNFSIAPGGREHGAGSETGLVTVTTQDNCPWQAGSTNSWITILSTPTNAGAGTVAYAVTANPGLLRRSGTLEIGGQSFSVTQSGIPSPPVIIGPVQVSTLGLSSGSGPFGSNSAALVYLVDQNQSSGGGGVLPVVSVDWDTNIQFKLTVSAPAGNKFQVHVPAGAQAGFGGFLWWESPGRGGFSPVGPVTADFDNLEGVPPVFSGSDAVLSSSHGFFGFEDLEGTTVSNDFAFTSLTLTGTVLPQYTGQGSETFTPHLESSLYLYCSGGTAGSLVSIVPVIPPPALQIQSTLPSHVTLSLRGTKPGPYVIERSEDFVHWTRIATNETGSVVDTAGSNVTRRFYRARLLL